MRPATDQEIDALPYSDPFRRKVLKLFYVPKDDRFMQAAFEVRESSTDKRHSTGAVVVSGDKILSAESNQVGFKRPTLIRLHEMGWCVRMALKVKSGTKYWLCPGCAKSHDHAESRASRIAAKNYPDMVVGSTLYLAGHWWCCKPCTEAMIKAGVTKVVLVEGANALFGRK